MITIRLFKTSDPFREIAARRLRAGEITLGVDRSVDWRIEDASGEISRRHCTLSVFAERLWLCDISTNGVFIGSDKQRAPHREAIEIAPGDTLFLGDYMLVLDPVEEAEAPAAVLLKSGDAASFRAPKMEALVENERADRLTDADLVEAFCKGAGLETSSFAGELPQELMWRLGLAYREVVDDLCELMAERASLKDSLKIERTTISARDNNPLKWAPARQVAVDLLRGGDTGFLKGAEAFKASFEDLKDHGACLLAGSRAAISGVLDDLKPDQIEAAQKKQPLAFLSRFEAAWRLFQERHAVLVEEISTPASGRIERSFRKGYQSHSEMLDRKGEAA